MARINIEDEIYKDVRYALLLSKLGFDEDKAIGALVRAWTLAQKHFLSGNHLIPEEEWEKKKIRPEVLEVGLAERVDGFIRVKGSENQFKWLTQRSEAGKWKRNDRQRPLTPVNDRQPPTLTPTLKKDNTLSASADSDRLLAIWNEHSGDLPKARMTPGRVRKLRARWKEHPDEKFWTDIVKSLASSPNCCGENKTGWRASIDWLLQTDNAIKISEGQFVGGKPKTKIKLYEETDEPLV